MAKTKPKVGTATAKRKQKKKRGDGAVAEVDLYAKRHPRYQARDALDSAVVWLVKACHQVEIASSNQTPARNYNAALRGIRVARERIDEAESVVHRLMALRCGSDVSPQH